MLNISHTFERIRNSYSTNKVFVVTKLKKSVIVMTSQESSRATAFKISEFPGSLKNLYFQVCSLSITFTNGNSSRLWFLGGRSLYCYLLDGEMSEDSPKITRNDSGRKPRPTMQLYCPRMLRTAGKKVIAGEENTSVQQPAKSVNTVKGHCEIWYHIQNCLSSQM